VGAAGATGAQGPAGVIGKWVSYRDFWFETNQADLRSSETGKITDIATYLKENPSLQIAIDGSMDPAGKDRSEQALRDLSERRVNIIRDSLIKAGVPADKIKTGAVGDSRLRRERRVEVLLSTGG
jgi:outer membrane protein OmpA-like peptidoglycan-associated protein